MHNMYNLRVYLRVRIIGAYAKPGSVFVGTERPEFSASDYERYGMRQGGIKWLCSWEY